MVDVFQVQPEIPGPLSPAQMEAEAAEAAQNTEVKAEESAPAEAQRPEWLPEKYKTPEDLVKSNKEAEKRLTQLSQEIAELKKAQGTPEEPKADETTPEATSEEVKPEAEGEEQTQQQEEAKEALEAVGLNMDDFTSEFSEKGELSPESFDKLEKAGIPKPFVEQYIAGMQALIEQSANQVFDEVGGKDNYSKMITWAAANLDEQARNSYDTAVNSGDVNQAKLAAKGLWSDYTKANGSEPNLIQSGSASTTGEGFKSTTEMTDAMQNPLYKQMDRAGEAYRQSVQQKLAHSNIFT